MSNAQVAKNSAKSNFGAKGWIVIILSFFCIMVQSSLINDSLNTVISAFSGTRGWSEDMIRMFSSVCSIISVFGAAIWGAVSSKTSVRLSWTLSLAVTAIAAFIWGSASSQTVFFICMAVASIGGMGFAYIANMNVISNWFPNKKGLAMGWVTIGFPLSASVTTPLMQKLLGGTNNVRNVYTFYGVVLAVLAVLIFIVIRDYPEQAGAYPDNDSSVSSEEQQKKLAAGMEYMKTSPWTIRKMLSTATTWKMGFSLGVMELLSLGIMTNYVPRCIATFIESQIPNVTGNAELMGNLAAQAAETAAATGGNMEAIMYEMVGGVAAGMVADNIAVPMLAVAGIIACFGSYLCGVLDAKFGPKKAMIATLIAGIIAILLNITNIIPVMYVSLVFLGFMLGGAANYLVSLTNTIWGRYDFPLAYKVLKPIVAIIGALGISVVGIIGENFSYTISYLVLAVLAVLSLLVIMTVKETRIGRADD